MSVAVQGYNRYALSTRVLCDYYYTNRCTYDIVDDNDILFEVATNISSGGIIADILANRTTRGDFLQKHQSICTSLECLEKLSVLVERIKMQTQYEHMQVYSAYNCQSLRQIQRTNASHIKYVDEKLQEIERRLSEVRENKKIMNHYVQVSDLIKGLCLHIVHRAHIIIDLIFLL